MQEAIIQATLSNYKIVQTRKVLQVILEVPIEQANHVTQALGWPDSESTTWLAVARLQEQQP